MKTFKRYSILIFLFFALTFVGQNKKESYDQIKALKTAFITDQLNLTVTEAQQFWPIYNLHTDKLHEFRDEFKKNIRQKIKTANGIDNLSETEAQKLINFRLATDKKIYETEIQMIKELSRVISQKKIIKLQMAELDFRRKLISKLRGKQRD